MSETPRTNAKERETYALTYCDDGDPSMAGIRRHSHYGWKLARELERELAAKSAEVERLWELLEGVRCCFTADDGLPDMLLLRIDAALEPTP